MVQTKGTAWGVLTRTNRNKFGAKTAVSLSGERFHSIAEMKLWEQLKLLERAGKIEWLTRQPKYDLIVRGLKIASYIGDFRFHVPGKGIHVVDYKGCDTPLARLKRKHFAAQYNPIPLIVVRKNDSSELMKVLG